jgi:hypothetical protein
VLLVTVTLTKFAHVDFWFVLLFLDCSPTASTSNWVRFERELGVATGVDGVVVTRKAVDVDASGIEVLDEDTIAEETGTGNGTAKTAPDSE